MIAVIDLGAPLPWWAILCGCALVPLARRHLVLRETAGAERVAQSELALRLRVALHGGAAVQLHGARRVARHTDAVGVARG